MIPAPRAFVSIVTVLVCLALTAPAQQQEPPPKEDRFERLERTVHELREELRDLKRRQAEDEESAAAPHWTDRFQLGGYGEIHGNFGEGSTKDVVDIHRLVLYLGYTFADWIQLNSETEIEHAYVSDGADGEISIEQLYVDFLCCDHLNVRFGRVLTPLGIVNAKHEPPTFNGVERPLFAKYIIPSTWSTDGIGVFGDIKDWIKYEAYVGGGLDGSEFDSMGIRGGRIKGRPSLNEPAYTGRVDLYPMLHCDVPFDQTLRIGLSAYAGGVDNGDNGNNPMVNGDIAVYSGDFEYTISDFEFRGAVALQRIRNANGVAAGVAQAMYGWYGEAAYHCWPEALKTGKLSQSDLVLFCRYDRLDTQNKMPSGVVRDPAGDMNVWTFGCTFFFTPAIVAKVDYQIRHDGTRKELDDLFNVGLGWIF